MIMLQQEMHLVYPAMGKSRSARNCQKVRGRKRGPLPQKVSWLMHMCQGHIPIIRIPIKGGRSPIPNIATTLTMAHMLGLQMGMKHMLWTELSMIGLMYIYLIAGSSEIVCKICVPKFTQKTYQFGQIFTYRSEDPGICTVYLYKRNIHSLLCTIRFGLLCLCLFLIFPSPPPKKKTINSPP